MPNRIVRVVAATAALPFNRCDNDHCVVYTSPPPTAEPLLKEKPLGGCTLQLSPIAAQVFLHPTIAPWQRTAQLDAGLAKPDRRGKAEANGGKLAFIRAVQAFTCHGAGRQVARATPSFINLTFSSTTQPSLVLSWAPRKYRNPLYLHRHKRPAAQAVQPAKPHRQAGDLAQGAGVPAQLIAVHRRQLLGRAAVGLVIHQHPRAVFEEA